MQLQQREGFLCPEAPSRLPLQLLTASPRSEIFPDAAACCGLCVFSVNLLLLVVSMWVRTPMQICSPKTASIASVAHMAFETIFESRDRPLTEDEHKLLEPLAFSFWMWQNQLQDSLLFVEQKMSRPKEIVRQGKATALMRPHIHAMEVMGVDVKVFPGNLHEILSSQSLPLMKAFHETI